MMGKAPIRLITDGLGSYQNAYESEFKNPARQTEHIREIAFNEEIHNNKRERLNGEIRQREKVMRGLKIADTPVLSGYQIFHNFIREHETPKGKTLSETCGIEIKGANKWKTLIENASFDKTERTKKRLDDFVSLQLSCKTWFYEYSHVFFVISTI